MHGKAKSIPGKVIGHENETSIILYVPLYIWW